MQEIIIDSEFRDLIPPLDAATKRLLEENLIENGCRDALVVWNGTLVDGHHRYEICLRHNIPFRTVDKDFASREEALIWIISTQVSRRNLTTIQLSYFRGLHYRMEKKIQGKSNQFQQKSEKCQNDTFHFPTAKQLAEQYNVSTRTITRDAKVAAGIDAIGEASGEAKRKILSGEIGIDKKKLNELSGEPQDKIEEVASTIANGDYKKEKPVELTPEEQSQPLNLLLTETRTFYSAISKSTDGAVLKPTLRAHINVLRDLYKLIS